eukprot:s381_g30.t1
MDPYAVLGISAGFTFKELSEAYRAVAGAASGKDAETSLLRAASAFEVLSRANVGAKARELTSKTPPRSHLAAPLKRLKRALQGLEKPVRQRKLQELSKELRMELLKYMELTSISGRANTSSPLKLGACGLQRNRQGLFRAKINLEHISLYSSYTANLLAVEHHIFLVRLRHLVTSGLKRGLEIEEAFQEAFGVLEKLDLSGTCPVDVFPSQQQTSFSSFLHQQGIRTYLNIRAARWLGSTHRLLIAREQGWDAFRAEWISMMQHVGLSRVRKRVGHPAGIVDLAQRKMRKTARKPLKPLKLRASERPELKLCRAVKAAEAALAKLARLKRKCKAQQARSLPASRYQGADAVN